VRAQRGRCLECGRVSASGEEFDWLGRAWGKI
jgi:hypothetical protein